MEKLLTQVNIGQEFLLNTNLPVETIGTLSTFTNVFLRNAFVIAGVILLFLLIFGGLGIIIGAGQNNPEKAAQGRKTVTAALAGFLIIFCSYWIIQIVQTITGLDILGGGGL